MRVKHFYGSDYPIDLQDEISIQELAFLGWHFCYDAFFATAKDGCCASRTE